MFKQCVPEDVSTGGGPIVYILWIYLVDSLKITLKKCLNYLTGIKWVS